MPTATTSQSSANLLADAHRLFQRDRVERIDHDTATDRRTTEPPSAAATIFWSVSGTRLVGTRIFMSRLRPPATGFRPLDLAVVVAGHVDALASMSLRVHVAGHVEVAVGLDRLHSRSVLSPSRISCDMIRPIAGLCTMP